MQYLRLLALAAGLAVEFYCGWQTWFGSRLASPGIVLSALVGAVLMAAGLCHFSQGNRWLTFWLYLGLNLFIPVYGAVGSLVIALYLWRSRSSGLADQYAAYIEAEEVQEGAEEESLASGSVDQMVHQELSVQSYMDIVRGPDRLLKKALIVKILSEWTPNAVTLLKQALKDPEYEIRSYASTALTTIENRINQNILHLQEDLSQDPGNLRLNLKLAQSYLDYAGSGLLDKSSVDHYAHLAQDILVQIPEGETNGDGLALEVLALRGQAARLGGDSAVEKEIYVDILVRHPDHHETLSHLCGLYFRERNFATLRHTARLFLRHTPAEHPAFAAARYWSGESDEETGI